MKELKLNLKEAPPIFPIKFIKKHAMLTVKNRVAGPPAE
jgi:hypothetical protein